MTDAPTLRNWFESEFDFDDYGEYLFGEADLGDTLTHIHGGKDGKNVEAITHDDDFLVPYEQQTKIRFISEIDRIDDLDKLEKISKGEPEYRLIARQKGSKVAEDVIDRTGSRAEFEDASEWLRRNNPSRLGFIRGLKAYRQKAQSFRLVFG